MINKQELVSKIVKSYIDETGVSKYSIKKLSEIIYGMHPDLFPNSEHVRLIIRSLIGSVGKKNTSKSREEIKIKWNGFKLPEPEKNDYSKVIVNEKRIGILSDIHFPYYDKAALTAAISFLIEWEPDCIIINGDCIDCYHVSDFLTDPSQRDLKYELDVLRLFFTELRELFPNIRIIYKLGNHEERYERRILQKVPEFLKLEWTQFEYVIDPEKKFNIEVVKNKRIIKAGHLNIVHGHEFSKGFIAPVNVARGFYLRAKSNVIGGHHHRISEHLEQDINEKQIGAWSTGCLCELNPHYMPINNWQHGFAVVENYGEDFMVRNLKIINGRVL
jgi:predicted phosphodiesterase